MAAPNLNKVVHTTKTKRVWKGCGKRFKSDTVQRNRHRWIKGKIDGQIGRQKLAFVTKREMIMMYGTDEYACNCKLREVRKRKRQKIRPDTWRYLVASKWEGWENFETSKKFETD